MGRKVDWSSQNSEVDILIQGAVDLLSLMNYNTANNDHNIV